MKNEQGKRNKEKAGQGMKNWGYSESFVIAFEISMLGFILEIFLRGRGVTAPHMPYNLVIVLALVLVLLFLHLRYRNTPVIKWLSSVPCSVSAISVYALLVLLLGFIPQQTIQSGWLQLTGLSHLKNSWPFTLVQFYLLVSLGLVVLRRGIPFRLKNLGFLMNHFGLWITLIAAGLGSGDLKRVTIELYEGGEFNQAGIQGEQEGFIMPFSMKLIDFNLELYNPKIAVADRIKGEIIQQHGETLPLISKGFETTWIDWKVKVIRFLPNAVKTDSGFTMADKPGSMAAAFVQTRNVRTGDTLSGWITTGSMMYEPTFLDLTGSHLLILTEPEPKRFESMVVCKDQNEIYDTVMLEVNKPHRFRGWKLYQSSYDSNLGKYSALSVVEAVRDPWLPLVYAGILLLLGGAIYLFWMGRGIRGETE
jgi:hypothetical protein